MMSVAREDDEEQLARMIGGVLVADVAPEEQDVFDAIVEEYRASSSKNDGSDHPLAFGVGEVVQIASPYVYEASKLLVGVLIAQLGLSAKAVLADVFKKGETSVSNKLTAWIASLSGNKPVVVDKERKAAIIKEVKLKMEKLKADKKVTQATINAIAKLLA